MTTTPLSLTQVLDLTDTEEDLQATTVDGSWAIGQNVNGGISMAVATRALERVATRDGLQPHVIAHSAVFLSPTRPGEVLVSTEVLRRGRSLSTAQARLLQRGEDGQLVERVRALLTLADHAQQAGAVLLTPRAPSIPAPEDCVDTAVALPLPGSAEPPLAPHIEVRIDPACAGFLRGEPSGAGEFRGWFRFRDDRHVQPGDLYFVLDAFPPISLDVGITGWAPTLDFSGYLRGIPAPGWLQLRVSTSAVVGGLLEEDVELWDSTGTLVAQSRQLAGIRQGKG